MGFAMLAILAGTTLLYAGFKNLDPRSIVVSVFSGKPPVSLSKVSTVAGTLGGAIAGGAFAPPLTGGGTPPKGTKGLTSALQSIIGAIKVFPGITYSGAAPEGVITTGHITNSEHYHGNAVDIYGATEGILDAFFPLMLTAAKTNALPIHCLIYEHYIYSRETGYKKRWYDPPEGGSTHEDHIHASGWPSVGGGC